MKYDIAELKGSILAWEATIRQIESGFGPDGKPVTPAVKRHGVEIAKSIISKNARKLAELEEVRASEELANRWKKEGKSLDDAFYSFMDARVKELNK